jgi:hypothetical protein
MTVKLTMVEAAKGHCELVRNSTSKGTRLSITKMVSLAGLPATYAARLTGNELQMVLIPAAARLHSREIVDTRWADSQALPRLRWD